MSVPQEKMVDQAVRGNMAQAPAGAPQQEQPMPAEREQDPAKKQEQYHQLLDNISKMVDGEEGMDEGNHRIMNMLSDHKDHPGKAMGLATFTVGEAIMRQAEQNGIELSDDMLMAAAMDTIMMLSELASEAGFFEATEADITNAYADALKRWMEAHPDKVDWEGVQNSLSQADPQAIQAAHAMFGSDPNEAVMPMPEEGEMPAQQMPQQQAGLINRGMPSG